MSQPTVTTLVFPLKDDMVLLGMKKRGFGANWWNGFGGKNDPGESFVDCAIRETKEEINLTVTNLQMVARLFFYFEDKLKLVCAAYTTTDFTGTPTETDEMRPEWFAKHDIPYKDMWPGDDDWIPEALSITSGQAPLDVALHFDADKNYLKLEPAKPVLVKQYFKDAA